MAWQLRNAHIERVAAWGKRMLYKHHLVWLNDQSWVAPYTSYLTSDRIRHAHGGESESRILDRRFTLIQFARSVRALPGSTAECGVRFGVGSALICKTLLGSYAEGARHFGFDSFEGLPPPSSIDRQWRQGGLPAPLEIAQKQTSEFPFCELVKGWIPQSLEVAAAHAFRYVHIDVDLYQSTLDSLAFFYPRMVGSGVIILDDHGFLSCPGARKAAEEYFADKPEPLVELTTGQAVVVKR